MRSRGGDGLEKFQVEPAAKVPPTLREQLSTARVPLVGFLVLLAVFSVYQSCGTETTTVAPEVQAKFSPKQRQAVKKEAKLLQQDEDVLAKEEKAMREGKWSKVVEQRKAEHNLNKEEKKEVVKLQNHQHEDSTGSSLDPWEKLQVRRGKVALHRAALEKELESNAAFNEAKHKDKVGSEGKKEERQEDRILDEMKKIKNREQQALQKVEGLLKKQDNLLDSEEKAIKKGKVNEVVKKLKKEHDLGIKEKEAMEGFHKAEGEHQSKEAKLKDGHGLSQRQQDRRKQLQQAEATFKEMANHAETHESKALKRQAELEKQFKSTQDGAKELENEQERVNDEQERRLLEEEEKLKAQEEEAAKTEKQLLKSHEDVLNHIDKDLDSSHVDKKFKDLRKKDRNLAKEEKKQLGKVQKLEDKRKRKEEQFEKLAGFATFKQSARHKKVLNAESGLHDRFGKLEQHHRDIVQRGAALEEKLKPLREKK